MRLLKHKKEAHLHEFHVAVLQQQLHCLPSFACKLCAGQGHLLLGLPAENKHGSGSGSGTAGYSGSR
jgi:hypothetical protein